MRSVSVSTVLSERFSAFAGLRDGSEPAEIAAARREAFARFCARLWPRPDEERFRFTDFRPISDVEFEPFAPASIPAAEIDRMAVTPGGPRIVFVGGRLAPEHSRLPAGGVVATPLSDSPRASEWLGREPAGTDDPFAEWNAAFWTAGVHLRFEKNARPAAPVEVIHVAPDSGKRSCAAGVRLVVEAAGGSEAAVVETFAGGGGAASWTSSVTQVFAGENSSVRHVRRELLDARALTTCAFFATLARDARLTSALLLGRAALGRHDLSVLMAGPGAECELDGLFLTGGASHCDISTLVDHAVPHGTSRQLFHGVGDGRSRGVFTGRIIVRPDAQKTDAVQTNRNLLLSREALINSTPQLEILADDVKCRHGSTTGDLSEEALFYLRSRGISAEAARQLLTYAFASSVLERVPLPEARDAFDRDLHDRLPFAPDFGVFRP